jgi:hypothetical protein
VSGGGWNRGLVFPQCRCRRHTRKELLQHDAAIAKVIEELIRARVRAARAA